MRSFHSWPIFPPNLEPPAARSLSLLFMLQEFLCSLKGVEKLKGSAPEELHIINSQLDLLLLSSLHHPFAQKGGTLDKLCFYSEILLQASKTDDETMLGALEEMRNAIMEIRAKLFFRKKKILTRDEVRSELMTLYNALKSGLSSFFSALYPFLRESRTDENILMYLVEHRKKFNLYLGPKTIETLLSSFFLAGPHQLRAVICEGYTRRGFAEFYASQEPLLDDLEWETHGCPSPPQLL